MTVLNCDGDGRALLLGFLLGDREEEVRPLLPISPGLAVLYGLNGAGKSRTLNDIRSWWAGAGSMALALVQLPTVHPAIDWNNETEGGDWFPDWARRAEARRTEGHEEILRGWLANCLTAEEATSVISESWHERFAGLVDEWMDQRLILVRAVGSSGERGWVSIPAFLTGDGVPHINAEVDLFEFVDRHESWDDQVGEIPLVPHGHTVDGRTISAASHFGVSTMSEAQWYFSAGRHQRLLALSARLVETIASVDDATATHLRVTVAEVVRVHDGKAMASEALAAQVRGLESTANRHFSHVLQDAPRLRLHVDPIGLDEPVEWFVEDDDDLFVFEDADEDPPATAIDELDRLRKIAGLSTAQRRWAEWSIHLALGEAARASDAGSMAVMLVDEPEAALHRSAEAQMADYLSQIVAGGQVSLLTATHSPELLDLASARVWEVARVAGGRQLSPLGSVTLSNMHELGLQPSDLLRRQRGIILVEGVHDQIVLETLFGGEFRKLRVEVFVLRGTNELSPAKIRFLFDYTPAHVFVMLDNIRTSELMETWDRAFQRFTNGTTLDAVEILDEAECLSTSEGRKLREILQAAMQAHQTGRITPYGLTAQDIIEYLPAGALVRGQSSWVELRAQHKEANDRREQKLPFKQWLTKTYKAQFGDEAILQALGQLDAVPSELQRLFKTVEAHVYRS